MNAETKIILKSVSLCEYFTETDKLFNYYHNMMAKDAPGYFFDRETVEKLYNWFQDMKELIED